MMSPRFDVNGKTLPALSSEDYADTITASPTRNNDLQSTSA